MTCLVTPAALDDHRRVDDDALDALLRHPTGPPAPPEEAIDDGLLLAWRDDALSADDTAAVEALLARSPEARALLRALAIEVRAPIDAAAARRLARARPRSRTGLLVGAALVLVAAGVVAWVLRPTAGDAPTFEVIASSGIRATRGAEPALDAIYLPDSPVRIVLRPTEAGRPRPAARAWIGRDGDARPIGEPLRAVGVAAWALEVPARALFPRAGRYTLHFGLSQDEAAIDGLRVARPGVQWLSLAVEYRVGAP